MPTRTSFRNSSPVGEECMPIFRSGFDCSSPSIPESRTNERILRSLGSLPSSSLQMNTIVSAKGPLVMKVFEPLRTNSSPSRRAVESIEPKASEPELGSVMAQAPTFSRVSRSGTHRFFWAMVPLDMIAAEVSPTDTPMAVTMPGQWRHSSMMGMSVYPASPPRRDGTGFSLSEASPEATASSCGDPLARTWRGPCRPCRTWRTACAARRRAECRRTRAPP